MFGLRFEGCFLCFMCYSILVPHFDPSNEKSIRYKCEFQNIDQVKAFI